MFRAGVEQFNNELFLTGPGIKTHCLLLRRCYAVRSICFHVMFCLLALVSNFLSWRTNKVFNCSRHDVQFAKTTIHSFTFAIDSTSAQQQHTTNK